jgi:hypothetical protein
MKVRTFLFYLFTLYFTFTRIVPPNGNLQPTIERIHFEHSFLLSPLNILFILFHFIPLHDDDSRKGSLGFRLLFFLRNSLAFLLSSIACENSQKSPTPKKRETGVKVSATEIECDESCGKGYQHRTRSDDELIWRDGECSMLLLPFALVTPTMFDEHEDFPLFRYQHATNFFVIQSVRVRGRLWLDVSRLRVRTWQH